MTSDRRNPATPDRRAQTFSGRRATDPQPAHGTRASYQRGCTCTPCKAAEAAYRADLRLKRLKGLPILGVLVSPLDAQRKLRQFKLEGYAVHEDGNTAPSVERLGRWRPRSLQLTRQQRIRLSTHLRVWRLAQWAMLEGATPDADAPST
jgi:hypothetical protein